MSIKKRVSKILKTLVFTMEAASRFELENVGFAVRNNKLSKCGKTLQKSTITKR